MNKETCVALATASGQAGLSVLRLSGQDACRIADKIFRRGPIPHRFQTDGEGSFLLDNKKSDQKLGNEKIAPQAPQLDNKDDKTAIQTRTSEPQWSVAHLKGYQAKFGYVIHPLTQEVIDQVVLLRFKAPFSYTGEDVVELSLHGGVIMSKLVLEACVLAGARLAEPGEFTKRAFLNGKLDLAQAEAVIELIHSSSEQASNLALKQLQGALSKRISEMRAPLLEMTAKLELALQYPEHEDSIIEPEEIALALEKTHKALEELLSSYQRARVIKEGYTLALSGLPNAGKSSLLNVLTGKETAIVTNIAGTTRDVLEAPVYFGKQLIHLVDTAGLTETQDIVEQIGVKKAKQAIEEAHQVCWLGSLEDSPSQVIETLQSKLLDEVDCFHKLIILGTKSDLVSQEQTENWKNTLQQHYPHTPIFVISSQENQGISQFQKYVEELCASLSAHPSGESLLSTERHVDILREMETILARLRQDLYFLSYDLLSLGLQECMELLSKITGESVDDSVMREIFTKFCVGK